MIRVVSGCLLRLACDVWGGGQAIRSQCRSLVQIHWESKLINFLIRLYTYASSDIEINKTGCMRENNTRLTKGQEGVPIRTCQELRSAVDTHEGRHLECLVLILDRKSNFEVPG